MNKTLVLGRNGQLSSELRHLVGSDEGFEFLDRKMIDINHPETLKAMIASQKPTTVINAVAYVDFNKAETDVANCRQLNVDFVERLAKLSSDLNFHLVHFSSDYVFDGKSTKPYVETDKCRPLNIYGQSKVDGEASVFEFAHSATIIRTSWLYSSFGTNFLKTMLQLASQAGPLRVVRDQVGSPTWTRELARTTLDHFSVPTGKVDLYHFSGGGQATWFEFAEMIMKLAGKEKAVVPVSTSEFPAVGQRPGYSVLSNAKVEADFKILIPDWKVSLKRCLETGEFA